MGVYQRPKRIEDAKFWKKIVVDLPLNTVFGAYFDCLLPLRVLGFNSRSLKKIMQTKTYDV